MTELCKVTELLRLTSETAPGITNSVYKKKYYSNFKELCETINEGTMRNLLLFSVSSQHGWRSRLDCQRSITWRQNVSVGSIVFTLPLINPTRERVVCIVLVEEESTLLVINKWCPLFKKRIHWTWNVSWWICSLTWRRLLLLNGVHFNSISPLFS